MCNQSEPSFNTSKSFDKCWREVVCDCVCVQTELAVPPVPECVEVSRGGEHQGVILPGGDCDNTDSGEAANRVRGGRLQDPAGDKTNRSWIF